MPLFVTFVYAKFLEALAKCRYMRLVEKLTKEEFVAVVSPRGADNNHIVSVEVYSPDEDSPPKAGFVLTGSRDGTTTCTPQRKHGPSMGRHRGQPVVKVNCIEEFNYDDTKPLSEQQTNWSLIIYFHKGNVCIEKLDEQGHPLSSAKTMLYI